MSVVRNEIEAGAVYLIFALTALGEYTIWHSPAHDVEINRNNDHVIKSAIHTVLEFVCRDIKPYIDSELLKKRALNLIGAGIGHFDSFHVAHAEQVKADFITCDDRLLRKCKTNKISVWCGTPVDFCRKEGRI
ncbi:MAG: hypothetical protein GF350_09550 [Chitinivibrionales bacterium]|nr:hypothetical protein [Chitinivibrionales bacterium]